MAGPAPTEGIVLATRHQNQCGVAFRILLLYSRVQKSGQESSLDIQIPPEKVFRSL